MKNIVENVTIGTLEEIIVEILGDDEDGYHISSFTLDSDEAKAELEEIKTNSSPYLRDLQVFMSIYEPDLLERLIELFTEDRALVVAAVLLEEYIEVSDV